MQSTLDHLYKVVASGDPTSVLALLRAAQDEAADIRVAFLTGTKDDVGVDSIEDARRGAISILSVMIDRIKLARNTMEQQPNRYPETEHE